jgi:hypothetical protein
MPTSTARTCLTLRAGNGRPSYPDLVVEPGRAEPDQAKLKFIALHAHDRSVSANERSRTQLGKL